VKFNKLINNFLKEDNELSRSFKPGDKVRIKEGARVFAFPLDVTEELKDWVGTIIDIDNHNTESEAWVVRFDHWSAAAANWVRIELAIKASDLVLAR